MWKELKMNCTVLVLKYWEQLSCFPRGFMPRWPQTNYRVYQETSGWNNKVEVFRVYQEIYCGTAGSNASGNSCWDSWTVMSTRRLKTGMSSGRVCQETLCWGNLRRVVRPTEGLLCRDTVHWGIWFWELVSWCFEPSQPQRITSGLWFGDS